MYPVISYTLHISVCLCLGLIFCFYKGEGDSRGSTYRSFLLILAVICLLSAFMSAALLYLHVNDIDDSVVYGFASAFLFIFITGLYFRPFLLILRFKTKLVHWQDGLACAYMVLGLLHPLLFYQYQISHHSEYFLSISAYKEFLQTPECKLLTLIVYVIGALYLILSIYNTFLHFKMVLLWDKQHKGENVFSLAIRIFCFLFFAFLLAIVDTVLFEVCGCPYYADLPVCAVFALVAAIEVLNCKQKYIRLEHEAIRLQIEFVGARMFYRKSALELNDDENIHRREQAVVLRAIGDWASRADHPYLNEKLTITTLSKEIGIPEAVIVRHLHSSYGLYFDEYVGYLTSSTSQTLPLSHSVGDMP